MLLLTRTKVSVALALVGAVLCSQNVAAATPERVDAVVRDVDLDDILDHDVSLVFAAQQPALAPSVLGHIYIAVGAVDRETGEPDPLGSAFEFAAETGDLSTPEVIAKGLFGGFQAVLRRYSNWQIANRYRLREARDLWVYRLNLTSEERRRLYDALAVARHDAVPYRFATNNCATALARVFAAVFDEGERRQAFAATVVSPASVVATLTRVGAISGEPKQLRTSAHLFDAEMLALQAEEQRAVWRSLDDASREGKDDGPPPPRICDAIDAGLRMDEESANADRRARATRKARANAVQCDLGIQAVGAHLAELEPGRAHGPVRFALGGLWAEDQDSPVSVGSLRLGVHELNEPRVSEFDYVGASYAHARVSLDRRGTLRLVTASIFDVESFTFREGESLGWSSRVAVGYEATPVGLGERGSAGPSASLGGAVRAHGRTIETLAYVRAAAVAGVNVLADQGHASGALGAVAGVIVRDLGRASFRVEMASTLLQSASRESSLGIRTQVDATLRFSRTLGLTLSGIYRADRAAAGLEAVFWFP